MLIPEKTPVPLRIMRTLSMIMNHENKTIDLEFPKGAHPVRNHLANQIIMTSRIISKNMGLEFSPLEVRKT